MVQQFVNRERELEFLEEQYRKEGAFAVVYGRRRVGKTELVKRFAKDKLHIYFLADERGDYQNLKEMQRVMADFLQDGLFRKAEFTDWIELFEAFADRFKGRAVLIIDEFPYLISSNKAIPSVFQKIWDTLLAKKNIFLILLGSSISMMETEVLDYKSPLYGRRTGQWKLRPLKFKEIGNFFPNYSVEELLKVYAVTDGIPAYVLQLNPELGAEDNIRENILRAGTFLYQEAEVLLRQELREQANYFNILRSIGMGRTRYGEIVNFTELDKTMVSKYLHTLQVLHVIHKEFPATQKKETRNARYVFNDNYYNFWFRYVYPNKTIIEGELSEQIKDILHKDFNEYVSLVFEGVCRDMLSDLTQLAFTKIGRWWHKDKEIDIVALNEPKKEILFGECKWQESVNPKKVLKELKEKTEKVQWHNKERKEQFAVFAKSFKNKIKEFEGKKVYCCDLKDFKNLLKLKD